MAQYNLEHFINSTEIAEGAKVYIARRSKDGPDMWCGSSMGELGTGTVLKRTNLGYRIKTGYHQWVHLDRDYFITDDKDKAIAFLKEKISQFIAAHEELIEKAKSLCPS